MIDCMRCFPFFQRTCASRQCSERVFAAAAAIITAFMLRLLLLYSVTVTTYIRVSVCVFIITVIAVVLSACQSVFHCCHFLSDADDLS